MGHRPVADLYVHMNDFVGAPAGVGRDFFPDFFRWVWR